MEFEVTGDLIYIRSDDGTWEVRLASYEFIVLKERVNMFHQRAAEKRRLATQQNAPDQSLRNDLERAVGYDGQLPRWTFPDSVAQSDSEAIRDAAMCGG